MKTPLPPGTPVLPAGGFTVANLPYGVARLPDGSMSCVSALGGSVIDLTRLERLGLLPVPGLVEGVFESDSLNRFLACGRPAWDGVRRCIAGMAADDTPALGRAYVDPEAVEMLPPVQVGDFVDFSASITHATTMGRLLRLGAEPLRPNWRRMPVGYSGRASSVVVSGTGVIRPHGQVPGPDDGPDLRPSAALDFEAEVGFVVGTGTQHGDRVATSDFADHVAGVVLVNDWSARDVQAYESQPLGPFLGKSFATSVSPWVVTLAALEPHRVAPPRQEPAPASYLATTGDTGYDIRLEVTLQSEEMRRRGMGPVVVSRPSFAAMYWTAPQLVAHATVNGAALRSGDLLASGTVSGPGQGTAGCLMELTLAGERPLALPDGTTRAYLEDGDTVVVRAWAGVDGRSFVSLGEVSGTVLPARPLEV